MSLSWLEGSAVCCILDENHITIYTESLLSTHTLDHTFFIFDGKYELNNKICDDFNIFFDYCNRCIACLTSFFYLFSFCSSLNIFFLWINLKENNRFFYPSFLWFWECFCDWFSYFWTAQKTGSLILVLVILYPQDYCLCWN